MAHQGTVAELLTGKKDGKAHAIGTLLLHPPTAGPDWVASMAVRAFDSGEVAVKPDEQSLVYGQDGRLYSAFRCELSFPGNTRQHKAATQVLGTLIAQANNFASSHPEAQVTGAAYPFKPLEKPGYDQIVTVGPALTGVQP